MPDFWSNFFRKGAKKKKIFFNSARNTEKITFDNFISI